MLMIYCQFKRSKIKQELLIDYARSDKDETLAVKIKLQIKVLQR